MTNRFPLTIAQAAEINLCHTCNFAGRLERQQKTCNYHGHPSLNYLHVPAGRCALTQADINRRKFEYEYVRGVFGKAV
jgi:hypothetical protein